MLAMFKANERCYKRTFGLYGFEALNYRSELKILWDKIWIADRRTLVSIWSQMIAWSQAIAEVCFHMIADDRRTFCDLRSAIRDCLRSYGNQPLVHKCFCHANNVMRICSKIFCTVVLGNSFESAQEEYLLGDLVTQSSLIPIFPGFCSGFREREADGTHPRRLPPLSPMGVSVAQRGRGFNPLKVGADSLHWPVSSTDVSLYLFRFSAPQVCIVLFEGEAFTQSPWNLADNLVSVSLEFLQNLYINKIHQWNSWPLKRVWSYILSS